MTSQMMPSKRMAPIIWLREKRIFSQHLRSSEKLHKIDAVFGEWCSLMEWHGRPARESRARCACHIQTASLPWLLSPLSTIELFGNFLPVFPKH
jgi:hypothetical protein